MEHTEGCFRDQKRLNIWEKQKTNIKTVDRNAVRPNSQNSTHSSKCLQGNSNYSKTCSDKDDSVENELNVTAKMELLLDYPSASGRQVNRKVQRNSKETACIHLDTTKTARPLNCRNPCIVSRFPRAYSLHFCQIMSFLINQILEMVIRKQKPNTCISSIMNIYQIAEKYHIQALMIFMVYFGVSLFIIFFC